MPSGLTRSNSKSDEEKEAKALLDDMLLSPTMQRVLCRRTNFHLKMGASIVARLDRKEIDEDDAFRLA